MTETDAQRRGSSNRAGPDPERDEAQATLSPRAFSLVRLQGTVREDWGAFRRRGLSFSGRSATNTTPLKS